MPCLKTKKSVKIQNWAKVDTAALVNCLGQKDWEQVLSKNEVEGAWNIFKNYIKDAVNNLVPLSTARSPTDPKWLTHEIVKLTRKKKRYWKTYMQHFSAENKEAYETVSKELIKKRREMLNEVKRENLRIQMTTTEENLQRMLDLKHKR